MLFQGTITKEVILELLQYPNAMQYQTAKFVNQFKQGLGEIEMIALYLCGTSGKQNAMTFMSATEEILDSFYVERDFFKNVMYNSEECIPVIIRAINIRLINAVVTMPEKWKEYKEREL